MSNDDLAGNNLSPKIGILDSGVGGFSVLLEIRKLIANVEIDYIGDSAWCPYGNKSPELIKERVFTLARHLIERGATIIVIACNSATIHAVEAAREEFEIPFVGMEPAIKPASKATQTNTIGVLATEASIAGEKFHHLLHTHAPPSKIKVITQPCIKFVELVEQGILTGEQVDAAIRDYTQPMLDAGADTLVLGCTHYPFLRPAIRQCVGDTVTLICTGKAVARRTDSLLACKNSESDTINIFTTGEVSALEQLFPLLCPELKANLAALKLS